MSNLNFDELIWNRRYGSFVDYPKAIKEFIVELNELCVKHNMSISHELSDEGAFIVEKYDIYNLEQIVNCTTDILDF